MSSWEDLLREQEMPDWERDLLAKPAPGGTGPVPARLEPQPDGSLKAVPDAPKINACRVDETGGPNHALTQTTWRLGEIEPPDEVIRLHPVRPPSGFERPADAHVDAVRAPRAPDGTAQGWWFVPRDFPPPDEPGWPWSRPPSRRLAKYEMAEGLPRIIDPRSLLARRAALALPYDGQTYIIGKTPDDQPTWAWARDRWHYSVQDTVIREEEE